jgi:acyl carrier protein
MGLDTVELIMDFEREFKIAIPDAEAAKMATVREAAEGILKLI